MHHSSAHLTVHAASLSSDIKDWGTLVATLLLVGVTAWYVALTKRIADETKTSADSSRDAAKSSKEAAETSKAAAIAARRAADAAVADLAVNFSVGPYSVTYPTERLGVIVTCTGAAVFIHGARLRNAMRQLEWPHRGERISIGLHDVELEPQSDLPLLVHDGESVQFLVPDHLTRGRFSEYRPVTFTEAARAARESLASARELLAVLLGREYDRDVTRDIEEIRNPTIPFDIRKLSLSALVYYSLDEQSPAVPRKVSNERTFPPTP